MCCSCTVWVSSMSSPGDHTYNDSSFDQFLVLICSLSNSRLQIYDVLALDPIGGSQRLNSIPDRKLTQNAHVVSAFLLVYLDEVVKGVREILEQSILLVHLQPQDAVQELGNGAVCGQS